MHNDGELRGVPRAFVSALLRPYRTQVEVRAGRTTAIIGPSAAGRSTVIDFILRFHDPQRGAILVDDIPLPDFEPESYRAQIALVSQDEFIFKDTLAANLTSGVGHAGKHAMVAAARMAGIDEFIRRMPDGTRIVIAHRQWTVEAPIT